ncbi:MAG: sulfatase [Verrucomicrobiales bacterium]|nr:sulfatase [Verrucomicrobiales bacterium]
MISTRRQTLLHRRPAPAPGLLLAVGLAMLASGVDAAEATPPNIVVILADDLGWADLPVYGNRFHETPAIDRLAAEGLRFTQFYSAAVCSPTRANLQTGRHEARFGITQHIPGHRRPYARLIDPTVPPALPLEAVTYAERLAAAGYATGYFGKWHLGGEGYGPEDQGWQTVVECQGHTVPPAITGEPEPLRTVDFLTRRAVDFIRRHRDRPFALQVSHYAVHLPISTTPDRLAKYEKKAPQPGFPSRPDYAGLLEELDDSVGGIVRAIDEAGLAGRTLIVFVSDNGGLIHDQSGTIHTSNLPLRSEKGTLYEGGIRVPAILRWPGTIPAGTICEMPAQTADLHPTFLDLAGIPAAADMPPDGISLTRWLREPGAPPTREALHWHLPHYHHDSPASAIRRGDWKLIRHHEDGRLSLFDLAADPGETNDLSTSRRELAVDLDSSLTTWLATTEARMPRPNPDHDPARANELAGKGGRKKR